MSERIPGVRGLCARAVIVYLLRLAILAAPYVMPAVLLVPRMPSDLARIVAPAYACLMPFVEHEALRRRFRSVYRRLALLEPFGRTPLDPMRLDLAQAVACMYDRSARCWMLEVYSRRPLSLRASVIIMLEAPLLGWIVQWFLYPTPPDGRLLDGIVMTRFKSKVGDGQNINSSAFSDLNHFE